MDIQNLIPKHKSDIKTAKELKNLTYEQAKPIITELLEWLQDVNWPVAPFVAEYLLSISEFLNNDLLVILQSDDDSWKYWCLSIFQAKSSDFDAILINEIRRIANNPTKGEIDEDVNIIAKELLDNNK